MMSKKILRWASQVFLVFIFTSMLLMLYLNRTYTQEEVQQAISIRKMQLLSQLRRGRLDVLQRTMFLNPDRPPDKTYNINVTASEHISLERNIADTRPPECQNIHYDLEKLPKISVVVPFYNEALSMLLRTAHSILQRTPPELLSEVILVNDHSPNKDLGEKLEQYVKLLPKVKLVKMSKREGLIRARLTGARLAKGPVVMFQDAHTENNQGWAEPLLHEIVKSKKLVIQPSVDQIEAETIQYIGAGKSVPRGGFSWDLRYTWMELPEHEKRRLQGPTQPFRTATLVGCALAVHKEYFYEIGAFDDAFNVWGGENIELAWRTWMCGGQVLTHPCSRVGHTFKPFAYSFDGDREKIVQKNLMRIAELWMDDWKKYFLAATYTWTWKHTHFDKHDLASLDKRRRMKEVMQCRSFDWYLQNIAPELLPGPNMDALYYGEIFNEKSEACWYVTSDGFYVGITYYCFFHRTLPQNIFYIDLQGRLIYKNKCVTVETSTWLMKLADCVDSEDSEFWEVLPTHFVTGLVRVWIGPKTSRRGLCVMQVTNVNSVHKDEQMPQLQECDDKKEFQNWRWTYKFSFNYNWGPPKNTTNKPSPR